MGCNGSGKTAPKLADKVGSAAPGPGADAGLRRSAQRPSAEHLCYVASIGEGELRLTAKSTDFGDRPIFKLTAWRRSATQGEYRPQVVGREAARLRRRRPAVRAGRDRRPRRSDRLLDGPPERIAVCRCAARKKSFAKCRSTIRAAWRSTPRAACWCSAARSCCDLPRPSGAAETR